MATSTKGNTKLITELQKLLKSGKKVDEKALTKIGIDTSIKSQDFKNIRITNDFWNGLKVSVIDENKDLDGNPIIENKKLISRVKTLVENGKKKINFTDLIDLNIWTPAKEIILGNLRLKNYSDFLISYDYYEIKIIDDKKNIDGLWIDSAITTDRILDVLHKYNLSAKELSKMKETDFNKDLLTHFKKFFQTVRKGARTNEGDLDLILGANHNYAIELKLAKSVSKIKKAQEAMGQIEMYTRQFNGNFMLVIAGLPSEKNEKAILEVVNKAKSCKSNYVYLEAH